jgi:hypothetical protein
MIAYNNTINAMNSTQNRASANDAEWEMARGRFIGYGALQVQQDVGPKMHDQNEQVQFNVGQGAGMIPGCTAR